MKKVAKITVVVVKVGKKAEVVEIDKSLAALQAIVGGYIEPVVLPIRDVVAYVNEEGLLKHLPYNCSISGTHIVGDIVVVGNSRSGDSRSLTMAEQKAVLAFFDKEN